MPVAVALERIRAGIFSDRPMPRLDELMLAGFPAGATPSG
jgi:hypothetical protein